jgi:hypothetical protein
LKKKCIEVGMNEIYLTTGQISGLTQIGYMSLYRYVKDFPEYFSETARQHKRGRRWINADLELVQSIRFLYHQHSKKESINQILASGWRQKINPAYNAETLTRMIEDVLGISDEAKTVIKEAQKAFEDYKAYQTIFRHYQDLVISLRDRIVRDEQEIARIKLYLRKPQNTPSGRGEMFSVWKRFKKDLIEYWNDEDVEMNQQKRP